MKITFDNLSDIKECRKLQMNKCDKCPYFKDQFGNFVMCIKTSRFIDWEYWNNVEPEDCPLDKEENNGQE